MMCIAILNEKVMDALTKVDSRYPREFTLKISILPNFGGEEDI